MQFVRKRRRQPFINIISLIDILVVLLIFYIATTVFKRTEPKLNIVVPPSTTANALNTPSLESFLHWIEHGEADVKRDMERGRDEVRVMTVHGAKGLEADIVILPDTAAAPGGVGYRADFLYADGVPVFPVKAAIAPASVLRAKAEGLPITFTLSAAMGPSSSSMPAVSRFSVRPVTSPCTFAM